MDNTDKIVNKIHDALRLLFPDEMPRRKDLIERLKTFDEYTSVKSKDGKTSIYYSEFKPEESTYYFSLYIGGYPHNVNGEGNLIADAYEIEVIDYDDCSELSAKKAYDDDAEYIPILADDRSPYGRRCHALAARMKYLRPNTMPNTPTQNTLPTTTAPKNTTQRGGSRRGTRHSRRTRGSRRGTRRSRTRRSR
jgi:hypothetical protein